MNATEMKEAVDSLVARGLLVDSGERRAGRNGKPQIVYVAVPADEYDDAVVDAIVACVAIAHPAYASELDAKRVHNALAHDLGKLNTETLDALVDALECRGWSTRGT